MQILEKLMNFYEFLISHLIVWIQVENIDIRQMDFLGLPLEIRHFIAICILFIYIEENSMLCYFERSFMIFQSYQKIIFIRENKGGSLFQIDKAVSVMTPVKGEWMVNLGLGWWELWTKTRCLWMKCSMHVYKSIGELLEVFYVYIWTLRCRGLLHMS